MALPKLFQVNQDAPTADWALLIVRIIVGYNLFLNSGVPKLFHLSSVMQVDALGLGSGLAAPAMIYAAFALGICPLLIFFGFQVRGVFRDNFACGNGPVH